MDHYGYMDTKWVMIDACRSCHLMWLDTDELGLMSLMYARSRMRAQQIHKNRYEPPSLTPNIRANRLGSLIVGFLGG
jgi:Zn-finger nucleic acid-binding protein